MKLGRLVGFALFAAAGAAHAQMTTTNCSRIGTGVNCTTIKPGGGTSFTDCNRVGTMVNCNTFGNSAPHQFEPPASSSASDTSNAAAAGAGAAAVVGLGYLLFKGIQAMHDRAEEKTRMDRARRVATLVIAHDCDQAESLALKERDPKMAQTARGLCKTRAQAGAEPVYVPASASKDERLAWLKTNVTFEPGSEPIVANNDVLEWRPGPAKKPGELWLHDEAISPAGEKTIGGRSALVLVAFDCVANEFSIRASTVYLGSNLTGEGRSDDRATPMSAVRPGSRAEAWARLACRPAAPAATMLQAAAPAAH